MRLVFVFCLFISGSVFASALPDERNLSTESSIKSYLASHPDQRTLIGGCGEDPFAWTELDKRNNHWRAQQHSNPGNHKHIGCVTCAEDPNVKPNILLDLTKPVLECMKGRFDVVYFENLPPEVLGIMQLWKNAYELLVPGGKLFFDYKLSCSTPCIDSAVPVIRLVDNNPFHFYIQYNLESLNAVNFANRLKTTCITPFKDEKGNPIPVDKMLYETLIDRLVKFRRDDIEGYKEIVRIAERNYGMAQLLPKANSTIKQWLIDIGFSDYSASKPKTNPFNSKISDASLVEVIKKKV